MDYLKELETFACCVSFFALGYIIGYTDGSRHSKSSKPECYDQCDNESMIDAGDYLYTTKYDKLKERIILNEMDTTSGRTAFISLTVPFNKKD